MKFIEINGSTYRAVMDETVQKPEYKDLAREIMKLRGFNSDAITDIDIFKIPYKKRGKVIKKDFCMKNMSI